MSNSGGALALHIQHTISAPNRVQSETWGSGVPQTFTPDATGRVTALTQKLLRANGSGGWVEESVPFTALYNALGQLTSFTATGASPVFQWGHTYTYDNNANRTGGTITANGASMSFTSGVQSYSNRQTDAAGITVVSNAAGDITSLLGKTLAYDTAGRLSQATGVPPCPTGVNCSGLQTTLSRYNGWGQRLLRENDREQSVFSYGLEGFTLLSQTTRRLATSQQSTTEHIWLPTASGPMPVAAVIDGVHYAVHADHLNTPRRLSDSAGQTRWQWPYSGFGEIAPQATPAAGQAPLSFTLRYPGQIDDGNELFYNWHRFYEPRVGRYTKADPIGLEGGWNRFGYVGGNPLSYTDPKGLMGGANGAAHRRGPPTIGPFGCIGIMCMSSTPLDGEPQVSIDPTLGGGVEICDPPPPPPTSCKKQCKGSGIYDKDCNDQFQPPGVPWPRRLGGLFLGPSIKADGRFCLRIGVFGSPPLPLPSMDLGGFSE